MAGKYSTYRHGYQPEGKEKSKNIWKIMLPITILLTTNVIKRNKLRFNCLYYF